LLPQKLQIAEVIQELNDRFGPLPSSIIELLYIIEIRLLAAGALASYIEVESNKIVLVFNNAEILAKATFLKEYGDSRLAFQKYYNIISEFNTPYTRSYKKEFSRAELLFNLGMVDLSIGEIDSAQRRIIDMDTFLNNLEPSSQR